MLDFLKGGGSTESKIRAATNSEPLGPYNTELFDLSALTNERKALHVITQSLQKKITKFVNNAESPRRSYTIAGSGMSRNRHSSIVRRSSTIHATTNSNDGEYSKHLEVLKCLTVIVHLCQHVSHEFLRWAISVCQTMIMPLGRLSYHPKTSNAIYSKVELINKFCEDERELHSARQSLDQMRSELRPGSAHSRNSSIGIR